jgi:subtilisin
MSINKRIASLVPLLFVVVQLSIGRHPPVYAKDTIPLNPAGTRHRELAIKARKEGTVRVIVGLNVPFTPEGKLVSARAAQAQRDAIYVAQDTLLTSLSRHNAKAYAEWNIIPYMALEVDEAALKILASSSLVATIREDVPVPLALDRSIPLIGADQVWAAGIDGSNWAVAILDTGVQWDHEFFGGSDNSRVVSEACYSNAGGAGSGMTLCPNGMPRQETGHAADPTTPACIYDGSNICAHGTHVAGIAAGDGPSFKGVAPGASVIAIQVCTRFDTGVLCYGSDWISALDHVYQLRDTYNIAAVNMSLGGGRYTSYCDSGSTKAMIDTIRSVGIATVIAAGNDGWTDAIAYPACISTAVAVGASQHGDTMASFSNSSPLVDLLAPGMHIMSALPGNTYGRKAGTSMATPHVTGAWALLKSVNPTATVDEVLTVLQDTGSSITDTRNGVTRPRIEVDEAVSELNQATWLGQTTSWNAADNWSTGAAPSRVSSAIVPASPPGGNFPTVDADADAHNLIITDGARLNMVTNTLSVYGDWLVQGTGVFSATGGTVAFKGETGQTISMTTNAEDHFYNLQIGDGSSTPSVTLSSDLDVDGDLILMDGATLETGSNTLYVAGNWRDTAFSFVPGNSTVVLDGYSQRVDRTDGTVMSQYFSDSDGRISFSGVPPVGWTRSLGANGWWFTGDFSDPNWSGIARVSGSTTEIDAWLFSPVLNLSSDVTYRLQFRYRAFVDPQEFYVKLGGSPVEASMTKTIFADIDVDNISWITATQVFTVATDGTYYLGFNDFDSTFSYYGLMLDDIILKGIEDLTFHNLIVDRSSAVTFNRNIRGKNDLMVTGLIDMGDNALAIEGTLAGDGSLQQTRNITTSSTAEFLHLRGAALVTIADNDTDGSIPGATTVTRHNRPPGGGSPDPGEMPFYVKINPTTDSGLDTDLTICYTDWEASQGGSVNEDDLVLFRYIGGMWANMGFDARDTVNNCVTKYDVTNFSIWTLGTRAPLAGYGVAPLGLAFDMQDVDARATVSQTVIITNHNSADLSVTSVDLVGDDAAQFVIMNDTGETILTPGGARMVWISFDPSNTGIKTAALQITTDDDEPTAEVALSGTGVDQEVDVAPLNLAFGDRDVDAGTQVSQTVIITNDGTTDLNIASVTLVGDDAGEFSIANDSGEAILSPGSSRTLWVSFDPTNTGTKTAALEIVTDDSDEPAVEVTLSGAGVVGTNTYRIFLPLVANDAR